MIHDNAGCNINVGYKLQDGVVSINQVMIQDNAGCNIEVELFFVSLVAPLGIHHSDDSSNTYMFMTMKNSHPMIMKTYTSVP